MKFPYDIVIAGGGMVCCLLACALGDSSLKVAVARAPSALAAARAGI